MQMHHQLCRKLRTVLSVIRIATSGIDTSSWPDLCNVDFGHEAPNSDLNFAARSFVDFLLLTFPRTRPPQNPPNSPGRSFGGTSVLQQVKDGPG